MTYINCSRNESSINDKSWKQNTNKITYIEIVPAVLSLALHSSYAFFDRYFVGLLLFKKCSSQHFWQLVYCYGISEQCVWIILAWAAYLHYQTINVTPSIICNNVKVYINYSFCLCEAEAAAWVDTQGNGCRVY